VEGWHFLDEKQQVPLGASLDLIVAINMPRTMARITLSSGEGEREEWSGAAKLSSEGRREESE